MKVRMNKNTAMFGKMKLTEKIGKNQDALRLTLVTVVIFILMSALRPQLFLRSANFISMGYQIPELGFYSLGMMMAMLAGGIDLSIVSIGNLACIISAFTMQAAVAGQYGGAQLAASILAGIVAAFAVGLICGLINGALISYIKIPPMLTTMATSAIYTGIGIILTEGKSVSGVPDCFLYFGNHSFLQIPYALWLLILVMVGTAFLLNKTTFGFQLKMIGSNPLASFYTGMQNKKVLIKTYIYSGLISAVCGLEILARTNTAKSDYAATYVFQGILCAVLGATNPNGGFAKVSCLALALASLQLLSSGFNLLRLGGYFKDFTWGALLLFVLSIDFLSKLITKRRRVSSAKTMRG